MKQPEQEEEQKGHQATAFPQMMMDDDPPPLIRGPQSLMPDMMFGWKPEVKCSNPPIPLYFDFVEHRFDPYNFGENPN